MMEKLRIFFIEAWVWTNSSLYRAAMVREGLMYFLDVQVPVAHQFSTEKQHRDLVPVAHFSRVVGVHVEHIDAAGLHFWQRRKLAQHLLAQAAPGARVQQEALRAGAHRSKDEGGRRRRKI